MLRREERVPSLLKLTIRKNIQLAHQPEFCAKSIRFLLYIFASAQPIVDNDTRYFGIFSSFSGLGTKLLDLASRVKDIELQKEVIKKALSIASAASNCCQFQYSALICAIKIGSEELITKCLNYYKEHALDVSKERLLYIAIKSKQINSVHALHKSGANINAVYRKCDFLCKVGTIDSYETPMHFAAYFGTVDIMQYLFKNKAAIDAKTYHNITPLMKASCAGMLNTVVYLVEHGADVNAVDNTRKRTPLFCAVESNHIEIAKYLIKNSANINAKISCYGISKKTLLDIAVMNGNVKTVEYLLHCGVELSTNISFHCTPKLQSLTTICITSYFNQTYEKNHVFEKAQLYYASLLYSILNDLFIFYSLQETNYILLRKTIKLLLENGANPFEKHRDGRTIFHNYRMYKYCHDTNSTIKKTFSEKLEDILNLIISSYIPNVQGEYACWISYNFANLSMQNCFAISVTELFTMLGEKYNAKDLELIYVPVEICMQVFSNTKGYFLEGKSGQSKNVLYKACSYIYNIVIGHSKSCEQYSKF